MADRRRPRARALLLHGARRQRLWCGWACPQTVFTRRVRRARAAHPGLARLASAGADRPLAEARDARGAAARERRRSASTWSATSARPTSCCRRSLAGSALGRVARLPRRDSLLAYVDFVLVRQTFCKYLCPYARFQSVLFDRDTLVVGYDDAARRAARASAGRADGRLRRLRPLRRRLPDRHRHPQGPAARVHRLHPVHRRLRRRDGAGSGARASLIGYRSLVSLDRRARRAPAAAARGALRRAARRVRRSPSRCSSSSACPWTSRWRTTARPSPAGRADGRLGNAFTLRIENRDRAPRAFALALAEPGFELVAGENPIPVAATSAVETRVFVLADADALGGPDVPLTFVLERTGAEGGRVVRAARFLASGAAPPGGAHGGGQR